MLRLYSHLREYRKIFLGNYLCIGFVPRGIGFETLRAQVLKDIKIFFGTEILKRELKFSSKPPHLVFFRKSPCP